MFFPELDFVAKDVTVRELRGHWTPAYQEAGRACVVGLDSSWWSAGDWVEAHVNSIP